MTSTPVHLLLGMMAPVKPMKTESAPSTTSKASSLTLQFKGPLWITDDDADSDEAPAPPKPQKKKKKTKCRGFVTADVLEKGLSRGAIATG